MLSGRRVEHTYNLPLEELQETIGLYERESDQCVFIRGYVSPTNNGIVAFAANGDPTRVAFDKKDRFRRISTYTVTDSTDLIG